MTDRNAEFEDAIDEQQNARLDFFVTELFEGLEDIERTLDSESSKMLLNWVRDKVRALHEDFNSER